MFNIPVSVLKNIDTKKVTRNNGDKTILGDKVVKKSQEPTLYNIQAGLESLKSKSMLPERATRTTNTQKSRPQLAAEMMDMMNISIDDTSKDFSLLESESDKEEESNPNILDDKDFEETVNKPITAIESFKSDDDPFFRLDEIKTDTKMTEITDVSYVASAMNILNQGTRYFGKNKYF